MHLGVEHEGIGVGIILDQFEGVGVVLARARGGEGHLDEDLVAVLVLFEGDVVPIHHPVLSVGRCRDGDVPDGFVAVIAGDKARAIVERDGGGALPRAVFLRVAEVGIIFRISRRDEGVGVGLRRPGRLDGDVVVDDGGGLSLRVVGKDELGVRVVQAPSRELVARVVRHIGLAVPHGGVHRAAVSDRDVESGADVVAAVSVKVHGMRRGSRVVAAALGAVRARGIVVARREHRDEHHGEQNEKDLSCVLFHSRPLAAEPRCIAGIREIRNFNNIIALLCIIST